MRHAIIAPENDNPSELNSNKSLSSPSSNSGSEIIKLKLQLARQQEKLDMQSSQLRRTQAECEALKTENASLLNELAAAGIREEEQQSASSTSDGASSSRWFPKRRGSTNSPASCHGGSMQLLLDTNAKLMMDNKRLKAECTNIRQSFQQYIVNNGSGDSSNKKSINKKDKQRDSSGHNLSIENIHRVVKESTSRHNRKSLKKNSSSNRSEASRSTAKTSIADSSYCDDERENESVDQDEVRSLGKTAPLTKPNKDGKKQKHQKKSLTASQEFATSVDSFGWHSSWAELENSIRRCER